MSADLQEQIRDYYSWRFAAPPRSESVMPGRSKISVTLVVDWTFSHGSSHRR